MSTVPALGISLSVDNVNRYIQWVNSFPILSLEEEQRLAADYQLHGNVTSARQLVISHLRMVVKVAKKYAGYGLSEADLIQEGNIGLMKAVKRFDPNQGVRLVSFAIHWVKAEIHEFIIKNWRIVKIATTKAQRKLFFNLRKMKQHLSWFKEADIQNMAHDLSVKPATVREMEARMYSHDEAFDAPYSDDEDVKSYAPADYLTAANTNPEGLLLAEDSAEDAHTRLQTALEKLDERSRAILSQRFLSDQKATLQDLAADFNVSAERVRQLEKQALSKLKALMLC